MLYAWIVKYSHQKIPLYKRQPSYFTLLCVKKPCDLFAFYNTLPMPEKQDADIKLSTFFFFFLKYFHSVWTNNILFVFYLIIIIKKYITTTTTIFNILFKQYHTISYIYLSVFFFFYFVYSLVKIIFCYWDTFWYLISNSNLFFVILIAIILIYLFIYLNYIKLRKDWNK